MGNSSSNINNLDNPIFNKLQNVINQPTEEFQLGSGPSFNKGDKFRTNDNKTGTVIDKRHDVPKTRSNIDYYRVVFDNGQNESMFPSDSMINLSNEERKRKEEEERRRKEEERKRKEEEERRKNEEIRKRRDEEERKRKEEERKVKEEENRRNEEVRKRRDEEERRKKEEERKVKEEENRRREEENRKKEEERKRKEEEERKRKEEEERKKREEERKRKEKEEINNLIKNNTILIDNYENLVKQTSDKINNSPDKERLTLIKKLEEYEKDKIKHVEINKQLNLKLNK